MDPQKIIIMPPPSPAENNGIDMQNGSIFSAIETLILRKWNMDSKKRIIMAHRENNGIEMEKWIHYFLL